MGYLETKIKVCRESTGQCQIFNLPDIKFNEKFNSFASSYKVSVQEIKSNFQFTGNVALDAISLNYLLLQINQLDEENFEKVMDLYCLEKPNHLGLLIAFNNHKHYEVVSFETAKTKDFNELKRRAGALYFLNLFPDLIIEMDSQGALTDEYRETMFREGIRSGAIKLIVDKFYVMDTYILESCRNVDIDYFELEEKIDGV